MDHSPGCKCGVCSPTAADLGKLFQENGGGSKCVEQVEAHAAGGPIMGGQGSAPDPAHRPTGHLRVEPPNK